MTAAAVNNNMDPVIVVTKMIWKTEIRLPISTDTQVLRFFSVRKMILHKPKNSKAICPARFQPLSVTAASASPHCSISFFHRFLLKQGRQVKTRQRKTYNKSCWTVWTWRLFCCRHTRIFNRRSSALRNDWQRPAAILLSWIWKIFRGVYVYFMFAYLWKRLQDSWGALWRWNWRNPSPQLCSDV